MKRESLELSQREQVGFEHLTQGSMDKVNIVKQDFKAFVEERLNTPEDNKIEINEYLSGYQVDHPRFNRRHVLTEAAIVIGYELMVPAYSLFAEVDGAGEQENVKEGHVIAASASGIGIAIARRP
ncbi:hypothetical protein BGZ79_000958 [Entomortierella chlamydospora]|nr:hypothetical protein BGZ79_000958 [Entomortierella chlamydospora]